MYNNEYEDYMRNILGYPNPYSNNNNTYSNDYIYNNNNNSYFPYKSNANSTDTNYESMYPDIYRILQPMIMKKCSNMNYRNISTSTIDSIVDEIYMNLETDEDFNVININVTTQEAEKISNNSTTRDKRQSNADRNSSKDNSQNVKSSIENKSEAETRRFKNNTLRDLIKILLLNQIINNTPNRPPRPPYPPRPPRPHYRELENPAIYNSDYSLGNSYQFFN